MSFQSSLKEHINACFTGIWIQTFEPDEAQKQIARLSIENEWNLYTWDIARGWCSLVPEPSTLQDPGQPLAPLNAIPSISHGKTTIILLHNYHRMLANPVAIQTMFNVILDGKATRTFFVVIAPKIEIPLELEKVMVVLEQPLPTKDEVTDLAMNLEPDYIREEIQASPAMDAAAGLTRYEAEGAFALSIARNGTIQPDTIWELKESMLKKSGLLEMYRGKEKFSDLGGLDNLKGFCKQALQPGRPVRPKGILLLGVPGTGKSAFAKALGNETNRPTLILDVGAMFGSLVGETESKIRNALKVVDAMSPCILFVDEIEKALSGVGGQGDSGVATRLFGTLLTWLNDHTSDVFFIGTCNDISKLPPEFSRAERFDGIFFIDLPTGTEKQAIWGQYLGRYEQKHSDIPEDSNWTGAEIKACCRLSALLNVPLSNAAKNIVPVAVTAADKVTALREWASGRCLSANHQGIYNHNTKAKAGSNGRQILKGAK